MDNHTKEQRHQNMSHIKSESKPEEIVRKYLFSHGFRYRKNDKRYAGTPDIVLPKYRTVIFVNGCFWHQHVDCPRASVPKTNTNYWIPKLKNNVLRDKNNKLILEKDGWKVLVVWECMLSKKIREETLTKLKKDIESNL
ncbi:MAG: DNA mismatch endonuclease Vsr [Parasporobacterium sp.]|nr:DNA mismatch endonuclease Vsr [Parasporobacterium sp.]